jgi:hypothetical protein
MQYPPPPTRDALLLRAISDASTRSQQEKAVTRWLQGDRSAHVRFRERKHGYFDQFQWHGQLHWRNRLCSVSQSKPEEATRETE